MREALPETRRRGTPGRRASLPRFVRCRISHNSGRRSRASNAQRVLLSLRLQTAPEGVSRWRIARDYSAIRFTMEWKLKNRGAVSFRRAWTRRSRDARKSGKSRLLVWQCDHGGVYNKIRTPPRNLTRRTWQEPFLPPVTTRPGRHQRTNMSSSVSSDCRRRFRKKEESNRAESMPFGDDSARISLIATEPALPRGRLDTVRGSASFSA